MNDARYTAPLLIDSVLHELASDAENVLLLANALEDHVSDITSHTDAQKLRQSAVLVKGVALQLVLAATNTVGIAERLRLVADFADIDDAHSGELPS